MDASGRRAAIAVAMSLGLLAGPAWAGSFEQRPAGHVGQRAFVLRESRPSVFPQPVDPWKFWGVVNKRQHLIHRSPAFFGGSGFVGSGFVGSYAAPVVVMPPTADYGPAAVDYAPPAPYGPSSNLYFPRPSSPPATAPSSPTPAIVEYPTGRYELRGDGMTVPYAWVWIPKVPPPPPEAPPPTAASPAPSAPSAAAPESRPAAEAGEIFRWTDEQGVTHWTNKLNKIPERYRSQAQPVS